MRGSEGGGTEVAAAGDPVAPADVLRAPRVDSRESEMALLGAMIFDNDVIGNVLGVIPSADAFAFPAHRVVFDALLKLHTEGKPIDLVILRDELAKDRKLDQVGGAAYLASLVEGVPNAANALEYAAAVARAARDRELEATLRRCLAASPEERRNGVGQELHQALERSWSDHESVRTDAPVPIAQVRAEVAAIRTVERLTLGIPGVDDLVGGGVPVGSLTVVGGFTGVGKSWVLLAIIRHLAGLGHPVLVVSLEMGAGELVARLDLLRGSDDASDGQVFFFTASSNWDVIRGVISRWAEQHDGGLAPVVAVDYLQLVGAQPQAMRSREIEIVANGLRGLARSLGVTIFTAAQLNRRSTEAERPGLMHLREGSIEAPVDLALLLWRPESDPQRLSLVMAKTRFSATVDRVLEYQVDWGMGRLDLMGDAERLEPLALKVREYLAGCPGWRAKLSEVSRAVKEPGVKGHPSVGRLAAAAIATKAFLVDDGYGYLPQAGAS